MRKTKKKILNPLRSCKNGSFSAPFCGQGLDFYAEYPGWDKFLYFLAGGVVVFIGNELIKMFFRENDRVSPLLKTFAASGFSYADIDMLYAFFANVLASIALAVLLMLKEKKVRKTDVKGKARV